MSEDKAVVELTNVYAIIEIPENCVELTLECKVYLDGKLQTVHRTMGMNELREAVDEYKEAEDCGYIPLNAMFSLTEEGKRYVEELMRNGT